MNIKNPWLWTMEQGESGLLHVEGGEALVLRVPGGWIYTILYGGETSHFVPFISEHDDKRQHDPDPQDSLSGV